MPKEDKETLFGGEFVRSPYLNPRNVLEVVCEPHGVPGFIDVVDLLV